MASHDPRPSNTDDDDDDISTLPFTAHPAYGRGLWKSPIAFVPAAPSIPTAPPPTNQPSIAQQYLAIMFPSGQPTPSPTTHPLCGLCGAPVAEQTHRLHYLTPTHQAALPRTPTPSSIDRSRMGLRVMQQYGWDVDARVGLGAQGEGMLFPLVPREKRNKLGLGVDKRSEERRKAVVSGRAAAQAGEVRLDAGRVRKLVKVEKRKHDKLQRAFYGNDEVEKYLGALGG